MMCLIATLAQPHVMVWRLLPHCYFIQLTIWDQDDDLSPIKSFSEVTRGFSKCNPGSLPAWQKGVNVEVIHIFEFMNSETRITSNKFV